MSLLASLGSDFQQGGIAPRPRGVRVGLKKELDHVSPQIASYLSACGFENVGRNNTSLPPGQYQIMVTRMHEKIERSFKGRHTVDKNESTGAYLFTGGVGGLGIIAALVMLHQGRKHLLFVSRRDRVPTEALHYWSKITQSSATVQRGRANVIDMVKMAPFFHQQRLPRVIGVIHGAGVLSDGVIPNQSHETFSVVYKPKVSGSMLLHTISQRKEHQLRTFLVFSSAAGLFGNPGQSNHSAANTFLDCLAPYRSSMGQGGASINWGAMGEVGYAARHSTTSWQVPIDFTWGILEMTMTKPALKLGLTTIDFYERNAERNLYQGGVVLRMRVNHLVTSQALAADAGHQESAAETAPARKKAKKKRARAAESRQDGASDPEDVAVFDALQVLHMMKQPASAGVGQGLLEVA